MGDPVPTDRWQRVKNLFADVLEAAPVERQEILAEAAREDPLLASEAVALLRAHEDGGPFLEQMVASESQQILDEESGEAFVGRRVGPYEVLRSLGRGGMGLVFLARRADQEYQHDVAIKLIRGALPTEEILRRFRAERQTLANLAHPNIARLLDGGRTEDGLPYLVLEYVEGEPIDAFCESRGLSVEDRLRLFRVVCEAVQHAHRHLVVHRDLKPGNILVTPEGQVKLLDFGIAKLLPGASHEETSVLTRTTERAMTPDYASPEQIRGEAVTTASDVYSLGVLLYRILTGQHPYRLANIRASEVERIICDQEPTKPSSIVPRASSEKLRRRLRGDLDNIVLKALRKEPRRRYSSVDQFSEDLLRHLEGLPVTARQDTVAYRTGKFLRRHRLAVTAGALVILALLGGLATTTWQSRVASVHARRAEQERALADSRLEDVHRLATAFLFDFHDAIADLPGSTEARELVVARAVEYLDRLARESRQDDPRLQRELAVAYQKIGNVQGNPNNANLGDTASALASYRKALAIAEPLASAHPMEDEIQRSLAVIYEKLADLQAFRGDVTSARAVSGKSLAIFQRLAGRSPTAVRPQRSFAISRVKAGDLAGHPSFPNAGRKEEALEHYLRSATILERLHASDPSDGATTRYLGLAYERVGTMRLELGNPREALASYRRSLEVRERLARENSAQVEARRDVGIAYEKIGDASRALGDRRTALENYRRSLATFEALAAADPRNANARRTLASGLERMADALGEFGREEEAWGFYERALSLRESVAGDSSNVQAQRDLAETLREAARFAARRGRGDMARAMERRAEEIERSLTASARAS